MTAWSLAGGAAGTIAPLVALAAADKADSSPVADIPPASTVATDDPASPTRVRLESELPSLLHMLWCNVTPCYSNEFCICRIASNNDGRVCSTDAVCPPLLLIIPRTYLHYSRSMHAWSFRGNHLISDLCLR